MFVSPTYVYAECYSWPTIIEEAKPVIFHLKVRGLPGNRNWLETYDKQSVLQEAELYLTGNVYTIAYLKYCPQKVAIGKQ